MKPEYETFCREWASCFNVTKAYKAAYGCDDATAGANGSRLMLNNAEIKKRCNEYLQERLAQLDIKVIDVVKKLWERATADPNELVEGQQGCCRYCWGVDHLYQHTPAEYQKIIDRYQRDCVTAERLDKPLPDMPVSGGTNFDKRLPPDPGCPECNGEGVHRTIFKDTRYLSASARSLYAGIKETSRGKEILMHSQEKALELLGRHLAMFTDNIDHKNNGGDFKPMNRADFYASEPPKP